MLYVINFNFENLREKREKKLCFTIASRNFQALNIFYQRINKLNKKKQNL